jgi:hypothetical protein
MAFSLQALKRTHLRAVREASMPAVIQQRQDSDEAQVRCLRSRSGQHPFRNIPRMQFKSEAVDLNHRVGGRKRTRLL